MHRTSDCHVPNLYAQRRIFTAIPYSIHLSRLCSRSILQGKQLITTHSIISELTEMKTVLTNHQFTANQRQEFETYRNSSNFYHKLEMQQFHKQKPQIDYESDEQ